MADTKTDNELITLFKDNNTKNKAFTLIVKKYQQPLYWHIKRIVINHDDTNDILQNTFLKAYHALPLFRGDSNLYTWLYRIATNEALALLNKKTRRFFISTDDTEQYLIQQLQSDPYFCGNELQLKFQKAIASLPNKQRLVFTMHYFDEIPYEEISKILGTSVGALKASFHHAVKKIETYFENN